MDKHGWRVAIKTKPRGHMEVHDLNDNVPYQDKEPSRIEERIEVEQLNGLRDETNNY